MSCHPLRLPLLARARRTTLKTFCRGHNVHSAKVIAERVHVNQTPMPLAREERCASTEASGGARVDCRQLGCGCNLASKWRRTGEIASVLYAAYRCRGGHGPMYQNPSNLACGIAHLIDKQASR